MNSKSANQKELFLFNSISKKKEKFTPIKPGKVSMYVCGVTVYDHCHIGHARTYLAFDVLYRYLNHLNYDVTYVRNITDIDDKIITRANAKNLDYQDIVTQFTKHMHQDFAKLNISPPSIEPRATEHIRQMIEHIQKLIDHDFAYVSSNNDVYFKVKNFKKYGKLSGQNIKQLLAGARIEENKNKQDSLDFVLWKSAKPNEPSWESPWGNGRPGWHIECTAMSKETLNLPFDIHGGGSDLKFPHHENECAQTCAIYPKFANYWVHSGMVNVDSAKMSKSLGNFFTIKDVMRQYHPGVIRMFLISSHYRSGINYTTDNLESAQGALIKIYHTLNQLPFEYIQNSNNFDFNSQKNKDYLMYLTAFEQALSDDLNTPIAFSILFNLIKDINKSSDLNHKTNLTCSLRKLCNIIGIAQSNPAEFLKSLIPENLDVNHIEELIQLRQSARENKNWQEADKIRDQLIQLNIHLEDTHSTTIWKFK